MGRPPIGKQAMTAAERQRKRRARRSDSLPFDEGRTATPAEAKLLSRLYGWLRRGDAQDIAEWLGTIFLEIDRWNEVATLARTEVMLTQAWFDDNGMDHDYVKRLQAKAPKQGEE
jgi:hypothetical protein